ncbi:MAG: hypothetical protein BMS9Abin36_1861 [Gammaproteobacteria bacterium]|nr:MAG: hypothetical protein BMS9Abin36_1861 [Gammaproteobacteria bacterium]
MPIFKYDLCPATSTATRLIYPHSRPWTTYKNNRELINNKILGLYNLLLIIANIFMVSLFVNSLNHKGSILLYRFLAGHFDAPHLRIGETG